MTRREPMLNQRWVDEVLTAIAELETHPMVNVEDVQGKLQAVLPLLEGTTVGAEYDLIDLAAESLENTLFTMPRVEQRESAIAELRELRRQLVATRTSMIDLSSAFRSASAWKWDKFSDQAEASCIAFLQR